MVCKGGSWKAPCSFLICSRPMNRPSNGARTAMSASPNCLDRADKAVRAPVHGERTSLGKWCSAGFQPAVSPGFQPADHRFFERFRTCEALAFVLDVDGTRLV